MPGLAMGWIFAALAIAGCGDGGQADELDAAVGQGADDAAVLECPTPCGPTQVCCDEMCIDTIAEEGAPLISIGACDAVIYGPYANQNDSDAPDRPASNVIPNFSYAGYRQGGVAIPDVPTKVVLSPGAGDDLARIQNAIDQVSALPLGEDGFRGAVELGAGTFEVSDTIDIRASGVVLRGAGQGQDGTTLLSTSREQISVIHIDGLVNDKNIVSSVAITSEFVPVGARSLEVADGSVFSPGDTIWIERTPNQTWTDAVGQSQYGWEPENFNVYFKRTTTAITGNTLSFDIPIVDSIDTVYGGGRVHRAEQIDLIEETGVEYLRIDSVYDGPEDEDHAWTGVQLNRVANSWVRGVTAVHMSFGAVQVHWYAEFNTIQDSACIEPVSTISGSRRYPFQVAGNAGPGNLFQRNYAKNARHNAATGSRVAGPQVWLDSLGLNSYASDGPHLRWATGLLFDNLKTTAASTSGGMMKVQNRSLRIEPGHGWSGAQTLFYNSSAQRGFTIKTPTGAMNWGIGIVDPIPPISDQPDGMLESIGQRATPRSLYLAQLQARLGPEAVEAVTIPAQHHGPIWDLLEGWAGEGSFPEYAAAQADPTCSAGIIADTTCCAASCGDSCTGSGCGGAPGGGENCCAGAIEDSGRSCEVFGPPCVLP